MYIYLLNQLKPDLSRMNHMLTMISWNLFYPPLHDGFNILCTSKMNCSFTSLSGLLCNCPSLIFYNAVRFWGIINILKFHVPSYDFFLQNFCKFSLFNMKVLKIGILGLFLAEYKMHYLAIFLTKVYINCNWPGCQY